MTNEHTHEHMHAQKVFYNLPTLAFDWWERDNKHKIYIHSSECFVIKILLPH